MVYKDVAQNKAYHDEYSKRWNRENANHVRVTKRKNLRSIREQAIDLLGGVCVQCGYADIRALQVDHIIPIRDKRRVGRSWVHYAVIRGERDNLQVLCANCHAIKTYHELFIAE